MMHKGIVWSARFSPDGRRIVTASADRTARLWDALTGHPVGVPMRHTKDVWALFSSDGRHVVTASDDGTARVWNGATDDPVSSPMQHRQGAAVSQACFRRLDEQTGLLDTFASGGGLAQGFGLTFRPDGNLYVVSLYTKKVVRFNGQTGEFIDIFVQPASGGLTAPTALVFGPDGHLYVNSVGTSARAASCATMARPEPFSVTSSPQ